MWSVTPHQLLLLLRDSATARECLSSSVYMRVRAHPCDRHIATPPRIMLMSAAAWERCWCCSPRVDELFCCVSVCDVYITRLSITIVRPSSPHALPVQLSHAACAAHSTPPIVILMWGAVHALRSTLINLRQRSHFFRLGFVVCLRQPKAAGSFVKFLEGVGLGTVTIRFFFWGGASATCIFVTRWHLKQRSLWPLR